MPDQTLASRGNKDFNWNGFNSDWYKDHNYYKLREDDRQILEIVRDHFAAETRRGLRGIDVGSGSNLYPAMAMLPFCDSITMYEYAASNRDWLTGQKTEPDTTWQPFWQVLAAAEPYGLVGDAWGDHLDRLDIVPGDVLQLDLDHRYDMATMFFVAESISPDVAEFDEAVERFTKTLRSGGRFAAGFIKESVGYRVDETWYPAVSVDRNQVAQRFHDLDVTVEIHEIDLINPFREGYGGMIVAVGTID